MSFVRIWGCQKAWFLVQVDTVVSRSKTEELTSLVVGSFFVTKRFSKLEDENRRRDITAARGSLTAR